MDTKTFTIGVLSTTAVILLAALLVVYAIPDPALASGMTATSGTYTLTVGQGATGDEELIYIIDTGSDRLVAYRFDSAQQQIAIVDGFELAQLRQADQAPPSNQRGRSRP